MDSRITNKIALISSRFYRAHRPHLEDMRGIEGLFENLTTEAEEAAKKQLKCKELGENLPTHHQVANGTNGTTNDTNGTNGRSAAATQTNGNNESTWEDWMCVF